MSRFPAIVLVMAIAASLQAFAYIPFRDNTGRLVRRDPSKGPHQFYLNDQIGPGLPNITDDSDPVSAIKAAFQAWDSIDESSIAFAALKSTSEANVNGSVPNLLTFANTKANQDVVFDAVAMTVWTYTLTEPDRTLVRSDIVFNPKYSFSTTLVPGTYDIQAVCTHELGHAMGADHSAVIAATMYHLIDRQQARQRELAPDDVAFAAALYPKSGSESESGSISGTVKQKNLPLFGAHVVAFDGSALFMAGTLSNPDGGFTIAGLPKGDYMIYAEPLDGPVQRSHLSSAAATFYDAMSASFPTTFAGGYEKPDIFHLNEGQDLKNVSLSIGNATQLMNIEIAGRTAGLLFTGYTASALPLTARPGERFNLLLGGTSLSRVSSISQVKIYGEGVGLAPGATLVRFNFQSGLPGIVFQVEVNRDARKGARSILVSDGSTQSLFTGGMIIGDFSTPATTTTSTTTSSTTTTTFPTSTSTTTTTTRFTTSTSTTTTSTRFTTSTSSTTSTVTVSTTTTTLHPGQGYLLHFPFLDGSSKQFTGLALANTSIRPANVVLTAYNDDGSLVGGMGVDNPARLTLRAGAQQALVADQIFHFPPAAIQQGWIETSSDNSAVTGFFLIGDYAQEYLDGADVDAEVSRELVLPGVTHTAAFGTQVSLVNPDPQRAQVAIDLYDAGGHLLASINRSINSMGRIFGSIPALFGITYLELGHVEVRSDRGLSGAMMLGEALRTDGGPADRLAIVRAQPRLLQTQRIYIPQFLSGNGFNSRAILTNPAAGMANVVITFCAANAQPLAPSIIQSLAPHTSYMIEPASFGAGINLPAGAEGYLRIETSGSYVVGSASFEDVNKSMLAGVNTLSRPGKETYLSQLATGVYGYFTGIACLNASPSSSVVEVSAHDPFGLRIAQGTRVLQEGQRFVGLVEQLTGLAGPQQGGYIRILSSQPVICFGLVGTDRTLASLPSQNVNP